MQVCRIATSNAGTAAIARDTPAAENYGAIQDVAEPRAFRRSGSPASRSTTPLSDAELEVQDLLDG